jgi:hypothetical protein
MDNLKEKILSEIRSGQIKMRPRLYFVLQVVALVVLALLVLGISVFIINFILFSIRLNRIDSFLGFGPRGWGAFVHFFPWTLLLADIGLIALLEWLVRRFRFGSKIPVLYLLGGLLLLTVFTATMLDRGTPFNDDLFRMRAGLPPPFSLIYQQARHHDVDDTLILFGVPPEPGEGGASSSSPTP